MSREKRTQVLAELTESLSIDEKAPFALEALGGLLRKDEATVKQLASTDNKLLGNMLYLTESPDEHLASRAEHINTAIESVLSKGNGENTTSAAMKVLQDGLSQAGENSVSYVKLFF